MKRGWLEWNSMGEPPTTSTSADRLAAALVLVALVGACVLFAFIGVALAFFTDSCGVASTECNAGLVAVGTALASVVPWLLVVGGTVAVAVRAIRGRPMGRVPWASLVGAVTIALIGVAIVFLGDGFGGG